MLFSLSITSISSAQLAEVKYYGLLRNWMTVNQDDILILKKDGHVFQGHESGDL